MFLWPCHPSSNPSPVSFYLKFAPPFCDLRYMPFLPLGLCFFLLSLTWHLPTCPAEWNPSAAASLRKLSVFPWRREGCAFICVPIAYGQAFMCPLPHKSIQSIFYSYLPINFKNDWRQNKNYALQNYPYEYRMPNYNESSYVQKFMTKGRGRGMMKQGSRDCECLCCKGQYIC